jgi:hypothetical protein
LIKVSFGLSFKQINQNFLSKMSDSKLLQVSKSPKAQQVPCPCPPYPRPSYVWRSIKFCNKLFIAGGLVYYTHRAGVWGSPEESLDFFHNLSDHVRVLTPYYIAAFVWGEK